MIETDLGVLLSGGQRTVTQELLNRPEIRAAIQQMRGEGMPQYMRADLSSGPDLQHGPVNHVSHSTAREPSASMV